MKQYIAYALAVLTLAAGCVKQNEIEQAPVRTRVCVGLDEGTKTVLGAATESGVRKVLWSAGDQIAINGSVSAALPAASAGTNAAEFEFSDVLSTPYSVLYPASDYKDATTVTLPAEQAAAEGTFADGSLPMYGYAETADGVAMHHLAAVLGFRLTGTDEIASVRVSGNASEQMSGDFTIDYRTGALTPTSTETAARTVQVAVGKTLSETATTVYVVVPAGTYASGLKVRIVDTDKHFMDQEISGSRTLEAGKIHNLPTFAYEAKGTLADVGISNAAEWNAFAARVNAGEKTLSAEIIADFSFAGDEVSVTEYEGVLQGGGHTVSGITAPLFARLGTDAVVDNLSLESAMVSADGLADLGVLASVNAGTVNGGTVSGSMTLSDTGAAVNLGGAVGHNTGTLASVVSRVDITVSRDAGTEINVGGLVGKNEGTLTKAEYKDATLAFKAAYTLARIGGVIGYNAAGAHVDRATNSAAITQDTAYPDEMYLGGVIGVNETQGYVKDANETVKLRNAGPITTGSPEDFCTTPVTGIYVGGVIGHQSGQAYAATNSNYVNNIGEMKCYVSVQTLDTAAYGGILGRTSTTDAVFNGTNNQFAVYGGTEGALDAQTLEVILVDNVDALSFNVVSVGGVVGLHNNGSYVQNVRNYNKVYLHGLAASEAEAKALPTDGDSKTQKVRSVYVGGIVGSSNAASAKVQRCTNAGSVVTSLPYQKASVFTGGIIGAFQAGKTPKHLQLLSNTSNGNIDVEVRRSGSAFENTCGTGGLAGAFKGYTGKTGGVETYKNYAVADGNVVGPITITVRGTQPVNGDRSFGSLIGYCKYVAYDGTSFEYKSSDGKSDQNVKGDNTIDAGTKLSVYGFDLDVQTCKAFIQMTDAEGTTKQLAIY